MIKFESTKPDPLKGVYYLATPFSHKSPIVEHIRYQEAIEIAYNLNKLGYVLIEPIVMAYPKYTNFKLKGDAKTWEDNNTALMNISCGVIVCKIDGWDKSKGIKNEIEYAKEINIPVFYLSKEKNYKF